LTEQVSTERFDDFRDLINERFNDLKGAIDTLVGKVDAYNTMAQTQSQEIAILKVKTEELEKLKPKIECQNELLVRIDESGKARHRYTLLIFSVISILIALASNWDKIFK
jgi:hypothetical protein